MQRLRPKVLPGRRELSHLISSPLGSCPRKVVINRHLSSSGEKDREKTHFGFSDVPLKEKKGMVAGVFHNVADSYDLMNDLMSGGMHRLWKDDFVQTLSPMPDSDILDVAGGTGDIAFRIIDDMNAKASRRQRGAHIAEKTGSVTILDINSSMLKTGQERAEKRGVGLQSGGKVEWVVGDAEDLQIPSNSMDAYTIAFGIRNVTDIDKALEEAHRVLRKGGRFMCLEFSQVPNAFLRKAYDSYSFAVIPQLGKAVVDDKDSYQYLVESIRKFPNQEKFKTLIENAGFLIVSYRNLTFGVVAIHSGFKL